MTKGEKLLRIKYEKDIDAEVNHVQLLKELAAILIDNLELIHEERTQSKEESNDSEFRTNQKIAEQKIIDASLWVTRALTS